MDTISHGTHAANPDGRARAREQEAIGDLIRRSYLPADLPAELRAAFTPHVVRMVETVIGQHTHKRAPKPTKGYTRGLRRGRARVLARIAPVRAPLPVLALPVRARGVLRAIAGGRRETRHGAPRRPPAAADAPEPPPPSETRYTAPARLALVLASQGRSFVLGPVVVAGGRVAYASHTLADLERQGVNVAELRSALADVPEGVGIVVEGCNGPSFALAVGGALRRVGGAS